MDFLSTRHYTVITLVIIATATPLGGSAALAPAAETPGCPVQEVQDIGPACRHESELWEMFSPEGKSLGFTHGTDPVPPIDEVYEAAPRSLACALPAVDPYHTVVIYARAHNDADRYNSIVGALRDLVEQSNGILHASAARTGGAADIKTSCTLAGTVWVANVVLPTSKGSANFNTIVSDLTAAGYDDSTKKYWVFYDDTGACSCGGTGHVYPDSTPYPSNFNNGNWITPFFAVNFGYLSSARIMLHELGHNLGAVQNNAPHTTLGYHCTDGRDTMCYNDGALLGDQYTTSVCGTEVWDCNNDDYFHLCPAAGSYLAGNWNLGSNHNRYLEFDQVRLPPYLC